MSQQRLEQQLNALLETLDDIKIDENMTEEISKTAKRVVELKRRITLVNSIINNSTWRCQKILESNRLGDHDLKSKNNQSVNSQTTCVQKELIIPTGSTSK